MAFLLPASFLSCQPAGHSELKKCTSVCKQEFQIAVQNCGLQKDEMKKADCQFKAMSDSSDCVAKCNEGFMKNVKDRR